VSRRSVEVIKFSTYRKSAIAESIAGELLSLIREKELQPGDKLPPERELATMMHVSRHTLREALRALAIMNVIDVRQGDGTYIASLEPQSMVEFLGFVFALDDSTFLQLLEARKAVEANIAALAAERISDQELAELDELVAATPVQVESAADQEAFLRTDIEFHRTIALAARNPILSRFMDSIGELSLAGRRRTIEIPGVPPRSLRDHQAILQALKRRDPVAAQGAMLGHLEYTIQLLKRSLDHPTKEEKAPR
jgi:GntR family transcriptional repressor for pyruvate dehydrogenase complex